MFKKRAAKARALDLHQQTDLITAIATPLQDNLPDNDNSAQLRNEREVAHTPIYKRKPKANIITLQTMQVEQSKRAVPTEALDHLEIEQCFTEIRQWKQPEPQQPQPVIQMPFKHDTLILKGDDIQIEGNNEDILQIEIDEQGGFSPAHDNDEFMQEQDYEDVLIRKTLTRQNYERVNTYSGVNLHQLKQSKIKDDFLDKIKKVSVRAIKNTIARDLQEKEAKLQVLQKDLEYIASGSREKEGEMKRKRKRLTSMQQQLERVNKVIEYLYYYGDRVQTFTVDSVLRQSQQQSRPFNHSQSN